MNADAAEKHFCTFKKIFIKYTLKPPDIVIYFNVYMLNN